MFDSKLGLGLELGLTVALLGREPTSLPPEVLTVALDGLEDSSHLGGTVGSGRS